jgi:omega-6 fatty acid desaturase (delta-12 desaturase)
MPGSLIEVIDAIPDTCYEQPTARGVGLVLRDLAIYLAAIVALYFAHAWWLVGLLWLLTGFSIAGLFVLGHDAAHGALFANRRLNGVVGRMLMLPAWTSWASFCARRPSTGSAFTSWARSKR